MYNQLLPQCFSNESKIFTIVADILNMCTCLFEKEKTFFTAFSNLEIFQYNLYNQRLPQFQANHLKLCIVVADILKMCTCFFGKKKKLIFDKITAISNLEKF